MANSILSYGSLPAEAKLWIFLIGLAFPIGWALVSIVPAPLSEKPLWEQKTFPQVPAVLLAILGALAVYLRFYNLSTFSVWPHIDEGKNAHFALEAAFQNQWSLFYGNSRIPPFFVWGLGIFFKIFQPSLASLWLYSGLISVFTLLLGFLAARYFFSSSFAFIVAFILAFNFWSLSTARTAVEGTLVPLWECGGFVFLVLYLKTEKYNLQKTFLALLGIWTGLGFYVHYHWLFLALLFTLTVLATLRRPSITRIPAFLCFLLPMLLIPIPLVVEAWKSHLGSYLLQTAALRPESSPFEQLLVSASYVTSLFWGPVGKSIYFAPVWGGFFNPLISSLCDLGILELFRRRRDPFCLWMGVALGLTLLPGLLSNFEEFFRIIPLLPLLAIVVAVGCQKLLMAFPLRRFSFFWVAGLALSMGTDLYHLNGPYQKHWAFSAEMEKYYTKSSRLYQAYEEIEKIHRTKGDGLVFTLFFQVLPDETLEMATAGYNAAINTRLDFDRASWAAVLTNVNYAPFLSRRFPGGKVHWFSSGEHPNPDGGYMIWEMSLDPSRREALRTWQKASGALTPMIDRQICSREIQSYAEQSQDLSEAYPFFEKDRFLESIYWEKAADLEFKESAFLNGQTSGTPLFSSQTPLNFEKSISDLKKATEQGYPAAHLYERLGALYMVENNITGARQAFQKATKAPLNLTMAADYLQTLPRQKNIGDSSK